MQTHAPERRLLAICRAVSRPNGAVLTRNDTCGIVAFVGKEDCAKYLLEGLHILENRGYDSAGIASMSESGEPVISVTKFASAGTTSDALERLESESAIHKGNHCGIAHTRWATHGAKTDTNAHPHEDCKGRIAIVHNGVIQNCSALKEELEGHGIQFVSETDTEVIAQLIGHYMTLGHGVLDAVKRTQSRLVGTWGCVVLAKELPGRLIAMKNGSPLLIGIGKTRMFLASEPSAFSRYTKEYIALQDMEIAVVGPGDGTSQLDLSRVEKNIAEDVPLTPEPFSHWTIKEIVEQPIAIASALNYGGRIIDESRVKLGGLEQKQNELCKVKHLVIAACGTSLFAGMYGIAVMRSLKAFSSCQAIDAAEISHEAIPLKGAGILAISQSGETKDVHRALILAGERDLPCFSIVNVVGSLIARTTGCGIYINAGREVAVASTKAFTSQVCCLCLAALWFAQLRESSHTMDVTHRKQLIASLLRLPTVMGMVLQCRPQIQHIAKRIVNGNSKSIFVLGKGIAEAVAKEGALKIKEITYMHAEGYAGGALKHGPFALIEQDTPIILIIPDDSQAAFMEIATAEVKTRGAYTIVITDNPRLGRDADDVVPVPSNGLLTALAAVVPIQLLAFEMSLLRGINPDKPRNLAKAVTVD